MSKVELDRTRQEPVSQDRPPLCWGGLGHVRGGGCCWHGLGVNVRLLSMDCRLSVFKWQAERSGLP